MQGARHLSSDPRRLSLAAVLAGVAVMAFSGGCRATHVVTADADGRPQFEQLTLVYEITEPAIVTASGTEPLDLAYAQSHPLRAALISLSSRQPTANAHSQLRLTVQTPHPSGNADTALVTLEGVTEEPGQWQTVAQQTLSRTDVELLFVHLVNGGVCDDGSRPNSTTRIAVDIDGHRIQKPWTREPRLDRLAVETYDAGR